MNYKAKEVADLERIRRGFIREDDKDLDFKSIVKDYSKVEKIIFFNQLNEKITSAERFYEKPPLKKEEVSDKLEQAEEAVKGGK